jgi:hypothetical protein
MDLPVSGVTAPAQGPNFCELTTFTNHPWYFIMQWFSNLVAHTEGNIKITRMPQNWNTNWWNSAYTFTSLIKSIKSSSVSSNYAVQMSLRSGSLRIWLLHALFLMTLPHPLHCYGSWCDGWWLNHDFLFSAVCFKNSQSAYVHLLRL